MHHATTKNVPNDREYALLLASLDSSTDADRSVELRELATPPFEWSRWFQLAQAHGLAPLAFRRVHGDVPDLVPDALSTAGQHLIRMVAARNLHLAQEMHALRELFAAAGIECLFFKGPLLAVDAYGDLGLRASGDVDALVRTSDLAAASRLLTEQGFVPFTKIQRLGRFRRRAHVLLTKQIPFRSPERADIDLHAGVVSMGYRFSISVDSLLARSRELNVGGRSLPTLSIEDIVLVLCYQGVNNRWTRLKHICDLAQHITAHPEVDWSVVRQRAASMGGERIVLHGLDLVRSVIGSDLPPAVESWMNEVRGLDGVRGVVMQNLRNQEERIPDLATRVRYHAGVLNTIRGKMAYVLYALARRVVSPSLN